jgi:hypothetical protein
MGNDENNQIIKGSK